MFVLFVKERKKRKERKVPLSPQLFALVNPPLPLKERK
jgi:hypothetical protein